ncbi:MAG: metal ABC transporter permease [Candidatus Omnitrophota bacterium]
MDIFTLMAAPFAACLVLTGIHCYLGLHVVMRGVIFVDLALAQIAAFGAVLMLLFGYELSSPQSYTASLLFTFIGAGIFALSRLREKAIPQEAIIGIVYAVFSAAAILVLDRAPHGHEALQTMLVGSILYVNWSAVLKMFLIYLAVGVFHFVFRKRFFLISRDVGEARRKGIPVMFWDFLFYITFGFVVTSSVKIAGVLLVFSYLIVPAVCAMLLAKDALRRLILGWIIGFLVSILGLFFSVRLDLPTGASVVTCFGVALIVSAGLSFYLTKRT